MDPRDELREAVMRHVASGGPLPARSPTRPPDVESGKVGVWQQYCILSCQLWSCWMHWMGDRSLPCLKRVGKCPADFHTRPIIWRGYVSALAYGRDNTQHEAVVGFTQPALIACPQLYQKHDDAALRGVCIRLTRSGGRHKCQRVEVIDAAAGTLDLPAERNLEDFLWQLWRNDPRLRKWAEQAAQPAKQEVQHGSDTF